MFICLCACSFGVLFLQLGNFLEGICGEEWGRRIRRSCGVKVVSRCQGVEEGRFVLICVWGMSVGVPVGIFL